MDVITLKEQIDKSPLSSRGTLDKLFMHITINGKIKPEYATALEGAEDYQGFLKNVYENQDLKWSLEWAEVAKLRRRNWLAFFEPEIFVQNLKMKTDGLPIQMGTGIVLAPTASRDNIANLYVFKNGGFNRAAAEFVTSIGGSFKIADYDFLGIYGLYKYRGNVILEEWELEQEPTYNPDSKN